MISSEVRGARDLAALWRTLPVAVLRYRVPAPPALTDLSDTLRKHAWREHCAAPVPASCAEVEHKCPYADQDYCRADCLFPMHIGGGAPSWRMATLFVQWWPSLSALHLVALGKTACDQLGWAARCLRERYRLDAPEPLGVSCFGDLELRGATRWRMRFVNSWVVDKHVREAVCMPDHETVAREIGKSMRARAHKMTALCAQDTLWQRLGGHLVHHVADELLPATLVVESAQIQSTQSDPPKRSRGNKNAYQELSWRGEVTLHVHEALLPWLSLLVVCGGGENADKGKGKLEFFPLPDST